MFHIELVIIQGKNNAFLPFAGIIAGGIMD
jgi:hypothetical protein